MGYSLIHLVSILQSLLELWKTVLPCGRHSLLFSNNKEYITDHDSSTFFQKLRVLNMKPNSSSDLTHRVDGILVSSSLS